MIIFGKKGVSEGHFIPFWTLHIFIMCIKPYFHLKTRYFKIKIGKQDWGRHRIGNRWWISERESLLLVAMTLSKRPPPKSLSARLTNWGKLLFLGYSGSRARHLPHWEPLDPVPVLQLWWCLCLSGLLGQPIQFPVSVCCVSLCPVCQIAPLRHLGSCFTMRPACPSFNCMIGHKQKEMLCWG